MSKETHCNWKKVLLIEDNEKLSRNIVRFFALKDIQTDLSFNWKDGFYKAVNNYYDAIILDISLPEMNWLEVCKKLREKEKNVPIIMLTSRWTKKDIIKWLDAWADDYLVKPFDYDELIARINSLTRRNLKNKSNIIKIWDFSIDLEKVEVKRKNNISFPLTKGSWCPLRVKDAWKADRDNELINLSNLEFRLFSYLAQNKNKAISRKELYEKVWWEFDWDIMFSKTVEVYIWYLRKKLDKDLIKTIKWVGYMIK